MFPRFLPFILCFLFSFSAFAWVEAHSGSDSIRIVSHKVDVQIDGYFATTTVSLTFSNKGTETEGAIYWFDTGDNTTATALEVKIGAVWEKGLLLPREQAAQAYEAITGLSSRPRAIDPGLLVKEGAGQFTLHVYPVKPGGILEARVTWVRYLPDGGEDLAYFYAALGDETTAAPELSFRLRAPDGFSIKDLKNGEKSIQGSSNKDGSLSWTMRPSGEDLLELTWGLRTTAVPVSLYTAADGKDSFFLLLQGVALSAEDEEKALANHTLLRSIVYDVPLVDGAACLSSQPQLGAFSYMMFSLCRLSGKPPTSAKLYVASSEDKQVIEKSVSIRSLSSSLLAGLFLGSLDDGYGDGWGYLGVLPQAKREAATEESEEEALQQVYAMAERYGLVSMITSLLAIDPSDEFSRDVVSFSKKWGSRYLGSLRGASVSMASVRSVLSPLMSGAEGVSNPVPAPKTTALGAAPKPALDDVFDTVTFSPWFYPKGLVDPFAPKKEAELPAGTIDPFYPVNYQAAFVLESGTTEALEELIAQLRVQSSLPICLAGPSVPSVVTMERKNGRLLLSGADEKGCLAKIVAQLPSSALALKVRFTPSRWPK